MSVLVVGISHNSAPVSLLERVAPDSDGVPKLVQKAAASEHVTEATVIATCNRVEIYAEVDRFHGSGRGALAAARRARRRLDRGDAAAPLRPLRRRRGLAPLPGRGGPRLDGRRRGPDPGSDPRRAALGQELGTVGPALNVLFQQALRVGKRSRAETDIDRVAPVAGERRPRRRPTVWATSPASARWSWAPVRWPGWPPRPVSRRRRQRHGRQPHRRDRRQEARRRVRRPPGSAERPRGRARARRRRHLLHGLDRGAGDRRDGGRRDHRRPRARDHRPGAAARRRPGGRGPARRHPDQPGRAGPRPA